MRFILLVIFSMMTLKALATGINVTLVIPDGKGPLFWQMVRDISKASAKSLQVNLEILHHAPDRFASKAAIEGIIQRKVTPDYVIFFPFNANAVNLFTQLESAKIPFVTLEQKFSDDIKLKLGNARENYHAWLGEITYDNKAGGELLLKTLIDAHKQAFPNEITYITGVGGDYDSVAKHRQSVLEGLIEQNTSNKIIINQIFPMYWDPTIIHERFSLMSKRYPKTDVYWCASDQMALEILKEHQAMSKSPVIIGGFDWLPVALKKIKNKELTASAGSHFLMATHALIKIVDYHNGVDRFLEPSNVMQYEIITANNVDKFLPFIENKRWHQVDFSNYLFSKYNNTPPILTFENMVASIERLD